MGIIGREGQPVVAWTEKLFIEGFRDIRFHGLSQDIYGWTENEDEPNETYHEATYYWRGHITAVKIRDGVHFCQSVSVPGEEGKPLNMEHAKEIIADEELKKQTRYRGSSVGSG